MAPEAAELERERRLQRCRRDFRTPSARGQVISGRRSAAWSEELAADFVWLDDLAAAGHWGAIRLRDRIRASEYHAHGMGQLSRETLERLVARLPLAAEACARDECLAENPDTEVVARWLEAGGSAGAASEIREARALAGELSRAEFEMMSAFLRWSNPGLILHSLSQLRMGGPTQAAVPRLLRASANRGYLPAIRQLIAEAAERALAGGSLPDWDELIGWLETAGRARAAAELREAQRLAGSLDAHDLQRIDAWMRESNAAGDLLAALAADRLRTAGVASRDTANAMLDSAGGLGSAKAREVTWDRDWPRTADQRAFIEQWARGGPLPESARADCLRIALAMDRGEHPRPATAENVSAFYAWANRPGPHDAPLSGQRCYFVAQQLDPRRSGGERDALLARRWYERGIEMGDDQCLDAWLGACALGQLGLLSDSAEAYARLELWKAKGGRLEKSGWRLLGAARAMFGVARGVLDRAPGDADAIRWLRLAAAIGLEEAHAALRAS